MEVGDNFTTPDGRKFNIKQVDIDDNRVDAAEYKLNKKGEIAPQKGRPRKFTYAEVSKWFGAGPVAVPSGPGSVAKPLPAHSDSDRVDDSDILEADSMEEWKELRSSSPEDLKSFIASIEDKSTSDDW